MANGATIAKFYASLGIKVDRSELLKVDRFLKQIGDRFSKFKGGPKLKISNFSVDQKALGLALKESFAIASRSVSFEISRFTVNERALRSTLSGINGRSSHRGGVSSMGAGVMLGRAFLPIAAVAAGGYGLSALNQRNQQVVSAQLQSQAVVQQAGGNVQQGKDSFNWLRAQGNRIGFNYLDASPDYNKLLSGLTGAGMSVGQGQNVFKGFSELSRVNKLDRTQQQRVYRALSQIAGKNKLQSEELTGQLAESLPGAVSLFARAYQAQLAATGKGGGKQGQEAITELLAAMKKGQVKGNILTYAGAEASSQAAPSLAAASTASQAEQARYQNQLNDLSVLASKSGIEEGFARIFRTLNDGLSQAGPLVERLSAGFNEATKSFRILALIPQSFSRMLDGKDSFIGNLIGPEETKKFQDNAKQITDTWNTFKASMGNADWATYLKTTLEEINTLLSGINATINSSKTLYNIVNRATGKDGAISGILNDDRLSPAEKLSLSTSTFNEGAANMTADDWQSKRDQTVKNRTAPDFDYVAAGLSDDVPRIPQSMIPTAPINQTATLTFGDINIQSNATNAADMSGDIREQMRDVMSNAWSEAQLNYSRAGR